MSTEPEAPSAEDIGGVDPVIQMREDFEQAPGAEAYMAGYGPIPVEWAANPADAENLMYSGAPTEALRQQAIRESGKYMGGGEDAAEDRAESLVQDEPNLLEDAPDDLLIDEHGVIVQAPE